MLKFLHYLPSFSKKRISVYAIFRHITDEAELERHTHRLDELFPSSSATSASIYSSPAQLEFAKSHVLVSIVTSKKQFEQFATAYYIQQHWDHFELWCPCHGFDSTDAPGAVDAYYAACLVDEPLGDDLSIVRMTYSADELAHVLRIVFACQPVGAAFEDVNDYGPIELDCFTQNLTGAMRDCFRSLSASQLRLILQANCTPEVVNELFANPSDIPDSVPPTPRKRRARSKKEVMDEKAATTPTETEGEH